MEKRSKMKRVTAIVMTLALATSCFVGGAFARYITSTDTADSARVADFGVEVQTSESLFAEKYNKDDAEFSYGGTFSVASENGADKVVAPGTKGEFTLMKISGAPEVAVNVKASLNESAGLKMVTLPVHDGYTDYTHKTAAGTYDKTFNVQSKDYNPVVWTLKQGDQQKAQGTLQEIETFLSSTFNKNYEPNDPNFASNAVGTWTLSWDWTYAGHEAEDTYLGNVAAGVAVDPSVLLQEAFNFKLTVTQID